MDEDTEVLDWGNEDDEQQAGLHQQRASDGHDAWRDPEDAEDAVSLGGDDDDMQEFYAYQSAEQDSKGQVPPSKSSSSSQLQHSHSSKREHQRQNSTTSQKQTPQSKSSESPALRQSQSFTKLTHALPPKPVVSVAPFVHPLPAQTSTLASSMVQRERRSNGHSVSADGDLLPPDWEMRQPRGSETKDVFYYYNIKTHESTWNRPRMVSAGRSSPSKDRESGSALAFDGRSPAPDAHHDPMWTDSLERGPSSRSSRKDSQRRSSPPPSASLTYEDRHYRPGESSHPGGKVESNDRRDDYGGVKSSHVVEQSYPVPPLRVTSSERRRSRSLTPPRRDHQSDDRSLRSRRDASPLPAPIDIGTWRESQRDVPQTRQATVSDGWGRSRTSLPLGSMESRSHESRRDRRVRTDILPSPQGTPISKDQSIRHGPNEWPAPRNRSPPAHIREHSPPPNVRRPPPQAPMGHVLPPGPVPATNTPRHKTRFDHPASPPVPLSGRGVQRDDSSYSSGDTVPQRRGREFEGADAEIDAKRRRVDDRMNESAVARRAPTETIAPCPSLPDRPVSTPFDSPASQVDQSRTRKRLPLPPQSMRFLEASRNPSALPINAGQGSSSLPLPSQAVASTTQPQRFTNPVNDMPSGPRRQAPPGREDEIDRTTRVPPTKPASGRIRTRFDNPAPVPIVPQDVPVPTERDAMDVDHPPSSRMSHLQINEGLPRSSHGMYADRPGMVSPADAVPRGPRAMTRGSMPPQELQSASSRVKPKAPAQGPGGEGWGERRDREDSFSKYPRGPAAGPDMPGRRFDGPPDRQDTRMHPIADSKQQNTRDIRDLPSRPSRRSNDIPLAPARVSGTNSVPIGNKKGYVTDAEGESLRSPIDRYRPMDKSFEEPVRGPMLPAHNDMRDDYDRRISGYAPGPVVDRHRPHQVDAEMPERRGAVSSIGRTDSFVSERSESSATYQPSGLPSRPRKDYTAGERRKSRFDPEPAPLPPSSEPRIWMTREQSENLARVNQAESNARPHESAWQQLPPPNFGSGSNEPSLPPRWNNDSASGPYDGNTRVGAVDVAPRRRRAQDSQDRGRDHGATVDPYPRGPPSGLEGRLTSNYDTHYVEAPSRGEPRPRSPSPRSRRDIYPDPPRHEYRDMREYPPVVRGEPESWDRPASQETFKDPSPSLAKLHPDRARIIGPVAAPSPSEADASVRTSKPVRIRRPGPMSAKSSQEGLVPAAAGRDAVSERTGREEERHPPMSEPLRPGIKRGGSLLERLDLERSSPGLPDIPPPSLRERVEDPKRSNEDIGDVMVDGRRRRVLKPRRGRRGGAP